MKKIIFLFFVISASVSSIYGQDANGDPNQINNLATGSALGAHTTSGGLYSFAAGYYSEALFDGSFALGNHVKALGDFSWIIGSGVNKESGEMRYISNSLSNSLFIGFNSAGTPSVFVEPFASDGLEEGFVGIHTDDPSSELEVNGLLKTKALFVHSTTQIADGYVLTASGTTGLAEWREPANSSDDGLWRETDLHHIYFRPLAGGNVGIGTISPTERLHVFGNLLVESGAMKMTNLDNKLIFGNESSSTFRISRQIVGKDNGSGGITSQQDIITIDVNDRVGIGTNNPEAELHVHGKILAKNEIGFSAAEDGLISFGNETLGKKFTIKSMYNGSGAGKTNIRGLCVDKWGNVGIGTDDPGNDIALDVNGTIRTSRFMMTQGAGVDKILVCNGDNGNSSWQLAEDINGLGIWEESNEVAYYDGSVGIGTTDVGTHKLAVNGSINATLIKVTLDVPGSDYVFEEDYKLMPLTELEAYVNTHKHLPEVKSAIEFKENGYSLGKMDDVLLRKVEELTLYVIEQDKTLKDQQNMLLEQQELLQKQQEVISALLQEKQK